MLLKAARPPSTSVVMVAEMNRMTVLPASLAHCNMCHCNMCHCNMCHCHLCHQTLRLTLIVAPYLCKAAGAGNPQQTGSTQAWRNDN